MLSIAANPVFGSDNCQRCQAALEVGKFLAMAAPSEGPALAVRLCEYFDFNSDCATEYGVQTIGAVVTQVIANADVGGLDGQVGSVSRSAPARPKLIVPCGNRCSARTSSLACAPFHRRRL